MTAALPAIDSTITILGGGNTISGNDQYQIFLVNQDKSLKVSNAVLTNGSAGEDGGGAIFNNGGYLTLDRVTVKDSAAAGGGGVNSLSGWLTITRSAIHNNRVNGSTDGGGISVEMTGSSTTIISNTTIFGNTAARAGGIRIGGTAGLVAKLHHVTIVGNSVTNTGGGLRIFQSSLELRNSIIWGNTRSGAANNCASGGSPSITASDNIVGPGGGWAACTANQITDDPNLPSSTTGSPPHYALPSDSPAVDDAACLDSVFDDQRGYLRPTSGSNCDIGAYEYGAMPPERREPTSDDSGDSGDSGGSRDDEGDSAAGAAPAISTCLTLPGIAVSGISQSTQCQRVDAVGIANPNIREGDYVDAVDVWSWVLPNTQICFEAAGGGIKFIDTATIPRTVHDLEAHSLNGLTCAEINGPGILVLLPGDPPPARNAASGSAPTATTGQSLSGCMVRATASLNLRLSPGGAVIGGVGETWLLTAVERTAGWFRVDRLGEYGWISADYVETEGTCG